MSEQSRTVLMFVNGQAMSGGSINFALKEAKFLGAVNTAAKYRFYSVRDEFPGLWPVEQGGKSIPGEVYEVTYAQLRESLLPNEPSELELSIIELEDGSGSLSMIMREEDINVDGVVDITNRGGWLAYLSAKGETSV
ncbi:allophanate hydrolase-related protein [Halomonas sp. AOP25-F1-15]|uniref:allophanate hydrolase-related protein n=1 Tax=Halomonas sp. AOP25-F1-15 TaxID=3457709 RepID=UPI004034A214